jgi:hypothetical protein
MKKFEDFEKELIAALSLAGRSNESLKDQFGVAELQINSYVEKYKSDIKYNIIKPLDEDNKIDWDKIIARNDLTEAYIMENHLKLRSWVDEKRETRKDFIKRQTRVPYITIHRKDYESFGVTLISIQDVIWNKIEDHDQFLRIYPDKESFKQGELIYICPEKIYVKEKHLQKWGFKDKKNAEGKKFYLTTPLKTYRQEEYEIIEKGHRTFSKVLRNNKLHVEKNRSKEFNDFLLMHNYIK